MKMNSGRVLAFVMVAIMCMASMLCGCSSTRKLVKESSDTVYVSRVQVDTIYQTRYEGETSDVHDSVCVYVYSKNDTVYIEKYKEHTNQKASAKVDTIYRYKEKVDTIYQSKTTTEEKVKTSAGETVSTVAKTAIMTAMLLLIVALVFWIRKSDLK